MIFGQISNVESRIRTPCGGFIVCEKGQLWLEFVEHEFFPVVGRIAERHKAGTSFQDGKYADVKQRTSRNAYGYGILWFDVEVMNEASGNAGGKAIRGFV